MTGTRDSAMLLTMSRVVFISPPGVPMRTIKAAALLVSAVSIAYSNSPAAPGLMTPSISTPVYGGASGTFTVHDTAKARQQHQQIQCYAQWPAAGQASYLGKVAPHDYLATSAMRRSSASSS